MDTGADSGHLPHGETQGIRYLTQLERTGIIEMRPGNCYRLRLAKTFRWRARGPVMACFREHAVLDAFGGSFDPSGERC